MYRIGILVLLVSLLSVNSYAMESVSSKFYDALYYGYYEEENWVKYFDEEIGEEVLLNVVTREKAFDFYEIRDGKPVKLSIDEALEKINMEKEIEVRSSKSIFSVSSVKQITGSPQKLSQDVSGGQEGATISVGNSVTLSESFTVGGTTEAIKSLVRANAGVTWSKSLARSITTTHRVPAGRIAYVAFEPYYNEVKGTVNGVVVGTPVIEKIVARTPVKIGKICDGLEYLAYK